MSVQFIRKLGNSIANRLLTVNQLLPSDQITDGDVQTTIDLEGQYPAVINWYFEFEGTATIADILSDLYTVEGKKPKHLKVTGIQWKAEEGNGAAAEYTVIIRSKNTIVNLDTLVKKFTLASSEILYEYEVVDLLIPISNIYNPGNTQNSSGTNIFVSQNIDIDMVGTQDSGSDTQVVVVLNGYFIY